MSDSYTEIFERLLSNVATWKPRANKDIPLTACWPESGNRFTRGKSVLVIGRATNGFPRSFNGRDLQSEENRQRVLGEARGAAEEADGRLSWVAWSKPGGSVGSRSAFWRATRSMVRLVEGDTVADDKDWASNVAWSNLAKVAPAAGGNPSQRLYRAQFHECIGAIEREVAELDPGLVLLIAGESWYRPILDGLKLALQPRVGAALVRHVAHDGKRAWLCTERPDSRKSGVQAAFTLELSAAYAESRRCGGSVGSGGENKASKSSPIA